MQKYKIFFIALWVFCFALVGYVQFTGTQAKNDDVLENVVTDTIAALDTYFVDHNRMPESLSELPLNDNLSDLTYTKESNTSYKLCATYAFAVAAEDGTTSAHEVTLTETSSPIGHPKGNVCYSYTEKDSRLLNAEATEQIGADCTQLKQTSFQSKTGTITAVDAAKATITVGTEKYTLCRDVEIRSWQGATYGAQGVAQIQPGTTTIVMGSDTDHITTVLLTNVKK